MKAESFDFSSMYEAEKESADRKPNNSSVKQHKSAKKSKRESGTTESHKLSVSTSLNNRKEDGSSILKSAETGRLSTGDGNDKPTKRNKSVSFQANNSEVNIKKMKKSVKPETQSEQQRNKYSKKHKQIKNKHECKDSEAHESTEDPEKKKKKRKKLKQLSGDSSESSIQLQTTQYNNNEETPIIKKVSEQRLCGEKVTQKSKKKKKSECDSIEEDLQNMELGDNASSLANLLDDVKLTRKGNKKKHKNSAKSNIIELEKITQDEDITKHVKKKKKDKISHHDEESVESGIQDAELESVKERVKWNKRKWNKDQRPAEHEQLSSTILVDNLPLSLLTSYKKLLADHFNKYGPVKKVGVAETYPAVEPRSVFTTTLQFQDQAAAAQALEEDNMELCGSRVRVRRPLPLYHSAVVVRCWAGCTPHLLTPVFAACGRVRSIREIIKGSCSTPTAFVEFDGPDGVEQALQLGAEVRVGGKKLYVAKYEDRSTKKRKHADSSCANDSDS